MGVGLKFGARRFNIEHGEVAIYSPTMWEVPRGVRKVSVFLVGGGGGGGGGYENRTWTQQFGGSGGGGGYTIEKVISVTPHALIPIAIGAGGIGGDGATPYESKGVSAAQSHVTGGTTGGSTIFGDVAIAAGGYGGSGKLGRASGSGGSGGSGGGGGGYNTTSDTVDYTGFAGDGGSDGSNGTRTYGYNETKDRHSTDDESAGGAGQGTSTRPFKDSSLSPLGGGGGGAGPRSSSGTYSYNNRNAGRGGEIGGGKGSDVYNPSFNVGVAGAANTGSGGGGGYYTRNKFDGTNYCYGKAGGNGGSGICIIRY